MSVTRMRKPRSPRTNLQKIRILNSIIMIFFVLLQIVSLCLIGTVFCETNVQNVVPNYQNVSDHSILSDSSFSSNQTEWKSLNSNSFVHANHVAQNSTNNVYKAVQSFRSIKTLPPSYSSIPNNYVSIMSSNNERYHMSFTQDEIFEMRVFHNISQDIDMDPCKSDLFDGDIAGYRRESTRPTIQANNTTLHINRSNATSSTKLMNSTKETKQFNRTKRAATARPERVWDYAVIPYEIDANFSGVHKALFKQAMRHWENYTCVQFVERTDLHPNWIVFTERPCGCCSFVGKRGNGPQAISIGKNCDKFGIVVHELGHVVGFWHEHTRPDRDDWVTIIRENIMVGQEYNFNQLTGEEVNSMGLRYDYDSIMHYARNTFSKGTYLDTILPREDLPENKDEMPEIGQRVRLSRGDIAQTMALYGCPVCGRTFQDTKVSFGSPQHTTIYTASPGTSIKPFRMGDTCQWRVLATHGEKIILNVTQLDIPASSGCHTDFLEIRDGYWHKSELLVRLCGGQTPTEPIVSTGSRMLLMYKTSEHSRPHTGFMAKYEAVCGGELDMESGQLESPNYPEDYQPNKECIWRVSVPPGFQVALKFQSFEIENHDNCVYDYIEIRDGGDETAPKIGAYCGYKMPEDIKSTGNQLWIKFVSDGSVQKAGFAATFMKEYDECTNAQEHGCEHDCINTLGGYECQCMIGYELHSDEKRCEHACGGLIDTSNGTITSPSFPDLYPANKNCIWEVLAPPQWRITVNFTHFDIEGNNQDCEYDSLALSSKMGSGEIRRHGVFCGSRLPPIITSEGNSLRIEFLSDNSVQKSGFAAVFFTDKDECATNNGGCQHICRNTIGSYYCSCQQGFVLHENNHDCKEGGCKHEIVTTSGELSSPRFPDYYPAKKDCVWIFSTTPGHRIKLIFTEFEMEPHQECAYDHVIMYDGHTTEDQILGRFCGSKLPHPIMASDDQMLMVFKSDASVQRKGFFAQHHTVCGGHLMAKTSVKNIYSHSQYGDVNYDNKEDCDWIIEAPPGKNVHLSFLTFEMEDEQDCGYDFIEIFSGFDDTGPSYGRFCGNKIPPEIISVDDALLLRFKSDDTINSKGFSAAYVIIDDADNGYGDDYGGVVLSPDPIKPNLGGSGLGQNSRRGKARISFLVNRGPVQNRQIIHRQITTPDPYSAMTVPTPFKPKVLPQTTMRIPNPLSPVVISVNSSSYININSQSNNENAADDDFIGNN